MRDGSAVEANGVEMRLVVGVEDGVGAASVVDIEGAEGDLRHGEFSRPVHDVPRLIAKLLHGESHPKTGVILPRVVVTKCRCPCNYLSHTAGIAIRVELQPWAFY